MRAGAPDPIAELAARVAADTARLRECLRAHRHAAALAAARSRHASLETLRDAGADAPGRLRELLEAALRETEALAPEIARLHADAATLLQQSKRRARAAVAYRGLMPR